MTLRPLIALPLLLLAGCPSAKPPSLVGTGMDMFAPVELRVHPLSRITTDNATDNGRVVEVRIELADQMKDTTKGVGVLTFTLARSSTLTNTVVDRWEAAIDTPDANKDHWDSITRTYLFRRQLPAGIRDHELLLTATLALPNGSTVQNAMLIKQ
jgi:hypothetical protein